MSNRAAEANPQPDWNIEYHLAQAYVKADRPDQAIDHYGRTLQLNPGHVSAHINLGNLLMRYSPAVALPHFQTAVRLSPTSRTAHYDYAICLQALHRDRQAHEEFQLAGEIAPSTGVK